MPSVPSNRPGRSISFRIAMLFCATFSASLVLAFVIIFIELQYSLEQSSKEVITTKLREVSTILQTKGSRDLEILLTQGKSQTINAPYLVRLLNKDGQTIFIKPSIQEKNFDFEPMFGRNLNLEKDMGWQSIPAIGDEDRFDFLTERVDDNFYLQVGKSSEDRGEIIEDIVIVFLITGIAMIVLSTFIGFWYARKSLSPIHRFTATIHEIERGDLSRRLPLEASDDELRNLGETFNRMVARLEKLIQVMRESLDNVAHDIRTPLTRIRIVAEDALLSGNTAAIRDALEDSAESAVNISELVDQLISISEADAGTLSLNYGKTEVISTIKEVVDIYDFVAQEKSIYIEISNAQELIHWNFDKKRIKQVIANLLDNAIKFSPMNTNIFISTAVESRQLVIKVTDQGVGIPENEIPRIWDRLFRGDKSRTTKGLGLGLSIVRAIVSAHGGQVTAHREPDHGMSFSLRLPERST